MGKSVPKVFIPYVPCPKMKPHDLGSIFKSLEASTKKLEALTRRYKNERGNNGAAPVFGDHNHAKPPDLLQGCISGSLKDAIKSLKSLSRGHEGVMQGKSASNLCVVSKRPKSVDLCQEKVNKLREFVETYSAQDTTLPIHKLKSSLEDYHRRSKEGGKGISKEKKEMSKSEMQRKLEEYLDSLEPKSIEGHSYEQEDVRHVPSPSIEEEKTDGSLVTIHGAKEEESAAVKSAILSTYLSPIELYVNQRLYNPLSLKLGQVLAELDGKIHWGSSKGEARRGSCFISCSRVQNLVFYNNHCPSFKTSCLGGIICVLSTPHFHFYMLIRLQTSLVHSNAISYLLKGENGGTSCNMHKLPWINYVSNFENFRGLKYHSWVLSLLLSRMSISEMFILLHSRWKLFFNSEMDQLKPCWLVLKLLSFEVNIVQIHCKGLLEMSGISSASSLHGFEGVSALLVMFMLRIMHKNSSSPLFVLLCSTSCVNSNYGLSLGAYMLLVIQGDIIIVKLGVEPPWPFDEGYMSSIERKTEMRTNRGNESAHVSSLNVQFSILIAELVGAAPMSPRQAIMVFDPGGSKSHSLLEVIKIFTHPPTLSIQDLRSNPFQPREVAAGARSKGLSFFIPIEYSMGLPKRNVTTEGNSKEENVFLYCIQKVQYSRPDFEASYRKFYSCKSFDSCVIGKINMSSNNELWNEAKSYFILREIQFSNEPGTSEILQQFQNLMSEFKCSYLEFQMVKIYVIYMDKILKKSTFLWRWNQQYSSSRFFTRRLQRLSRRNAMLFSEMTCCHSNLHNSSFIHYF